MAKFSREFWLLPLFIGVGLIFAGLDEAAPIWFLIYTCLACVILALIYRLRALRVQVVRILNTGHSRHLEAGSDLPVTLKVENKGALPLPWLELTDILSGSLAQTQANTAQGRLLWVRPGGSARVQYTLKAVPRGVHVWEYSDVRSGDPLGLVNQNSRIRYANELIVYPKTVPLEARQFFPRRASGSAVAKTSLNLDQTQLVGVREYRPGDRLSLIHWKSSAKAGSLHSKEFEPLLNNPSLVVLDCSSGAWEQEYDPLFEEGVRAAASLIKAAWLQRIPVQFHGNWNHFPRRLSVLNAYDYNIFLMHMARICPNGEVSLSQTIYNELLTQGLNVVVITPVVGHRLQRLLYRLAGRGNMVTVIRMDNKGHGPTAKASAAANFNMFSINEAEELSSLTRRASV